MLLIDRSIEEVFISPTAAFGLDGNVANMVLFPENLFNLRINFFHFTQTKVVAVEVCGKDDMIFINHPGMDVVNVIDPRDSLEIRNLVIIQVGEDLLSGS